MTMKLVCPITVNGIDTAKVLTTAANIDQGAFVKQKPGVGKPFYMWANLRAGTLTSADFEGAPIVSSDSTINNALIQNMLDNPPDASVLLTWA